MAGQGSGAGRAVGSQRSGPGAVGPEGATLLAFDRVAAVGRAVRVREAGVQVVGEAAGLVAALEEAATAASGMASVLPDGLISGPALEECAALLSRRARECVAETERIAEEMTRGAGFLADADEEVARRVADAAG